MFGRDWQPGEATIVGARIRHHSDEGLLSVAEFEADVRTADGLVFRATLGEPWGADFWPPRTGDTVRVLIDARRRKAKFDKSDPALSYRAHKAAVGDELSAALSGGPATVPAPDPDARPPDKAARLERLEGLHEQGLVTEAEYAVQRRRIMEGE